jgi:hypothetical protein
MTTTDIRVTRHLIPSEFWVPIADGRKPFVNCSTADYAFAVGDMLVLAEYDPERGCGTGREVTRVVTYVLAGAVAAALGLRPDYAILGLAEDATTEAKPAPAGDAYELTIRLPGVTGPAEDPRVDAIVDHAMALVPGAAACGSRTGGAS